MIGGPAGFLTKLRFQDDGGLPFTLIDPLIYWSARLNKEVEVPSGFKTDLASIPRIFWRVLPQIGKYDAPAVVHDYLYATNGVTRAEADRVLLEAMHASEVAELTAQVIYTGVRLGGWCPWNRYRAQE